MKSFGWSIDKLIKKKKWSFVDTSTNDSQSTVVGNYDLGAFLARIEYAIKKVNAKRVAIDSISALFPRYGNTALLRRELHNITTRLKNAGVTAIMTAERPMVGNEISRCSFGWDLEKYVKSGKINLICHYPEDWKAEQYLKVITNLVTKTKATRVVLDSLSALERIYEPTKFREFVIGLNAILKSNGVTSM